MNLLIYKLYLLKDLSIFIIINIDMTSKYKVIDTSTKTFKSGQKINIVNFKAPKSKNQAKLKESILKYANMKSTKMKDNKKFKNNRVQIQLKYESGKYMSTRFFEVGEDMIFTYDDYDEQELQDFGRIVSFNITFGKI